ncbi:reverse transcriptase [Lasius niger]|uniref:Reverse transcriptase n=1 Tax=Lasius niger TaxID=67767 RepID=A0A0J7KIA9_LASNI|nr:reverse transcriptase [Lasius niger]
MLVGLKLNTRGGPKLATLSSNGENNYREYYPRWYATQSGESTLSGGWPHGFWGGGQTLLAKGSIGISLGKTDLESQALNYEGKFNTPNERRLWVNLQDANKKVEELLRENLLLEENISQITQRLEYLEKTNKVEIIEQKENEYYTDEEELERETDWIIKSRKKNKKRKANTSPEVSPQQEASSSGNSNMNLNPIKKWKEKKNLEPPPVNVIGVKQYQELHAITQEITKNFKVEDCPDLASDHSSVILTVSNAVIKRQIPLTLTNRKANWLGFRAELEKKITLKVSLKTPEQLEEEVNKFNTDIQQAAWDNTPMIQRRNMGYNYPKEIRDMVNMKRRARKKWQHTRSPEDKTYKKAPGFDLISGNILKELPRKGLAKFLHLTNAVIRLKCFPESWKVAEVIMIPKPGKPENEVTSYRPISLLPIMSKILERLLLKRLKPIIEERKLIPSHQFGFREKHSTIDQVHRITNIIERALEEKQICSSIFLDVAQAFDKIGTFV